jgi:hypothetical protein
METIEIMRDLLAPYANDDQYTPEGQIVWLKRKNFSPQIIDAAMTDIYFGLSQGKTYEDGHALDRVLLKTAQAYEAIEARNLISSGNTLKKQIEGGKLKKLWWVLKGEL